MRRILLAIALLCSLGSLAQTTPVKKTAMIKALGVSFVDMGEGQQPKRIEENKNLDKFFYDANGNMVQTSKYTFIKGTMVLKKDTIYTYDASNKLVCDSSDKMKTNYYYDSQGKLERVVSYSYRSLNPQRRDSVVCTYDANNRLIVKTHYNDKSVKRSEEKYIYDVGGKLSNIETHSFQASGNSKKSMQTNYFYNSANLLAEEQVVKFSGTKEDMQSRKLYTYDANGRLESDTIYAKVKSNFRLTMKHVYHYDGAELIPTSVEEFSYNSQTENFTETAKMEYVNGIHSADRVPLNVKVSKGDKITDVKIALNQPTDAQGLMGYNVIADYIVLDTIFKGNEFTIPGQTRGKHCYRVVPVYADNITANCSELISHEINITLSAPKNPVLVSKEYYTRWVVKFKWDAPDSQGATLKGYRWKAQNGTNMSTGNTNDPEQLFGTFDYYGKEVAEVSLYAIYEEGESDPVIFSLDLSDTKDQITEHWQNQGFTTKNANGTTTQIGRYYYNSSSIGEELDFQVNCLPDGTPTERRICTTKLYSTKLLTDITEAYDAESLGWKNHIKIVYGYTPAGTLESKTTYRFDTDAKEFRKKEAEWYHFDYSVSYSTPAQTTRYEFNSEDDSTLVAFIKTSLTDKVAGVYTQTDKVFNSDGPLAGLLGQVETVYADKNKMISRTVSNIINGNLTLDTRTCREYSKETNLCTREVEEKYEGGTWKLTSEKLFIPSKEYHFTRTPKSLHFSDNTLTWAEPERTKDLTGYKILINGVEKATVTERSYKPTGLKNGKYIFIVMPLYNGSDGSLSKALNVKINNPADGISAVSSDNIQISDDRATVSSAVRIEAYDTNGRKLASSVGSTIALPRQSKGLLLLKAVYSDGSRRTFKLAR